MLKFRQVVKSRSIGLLCRFFHFCYKKFLPVQPGKYLIGGFLPEGTGAAAFFVLPGPCDAAGLTGEAIVILGLKRADLLFASGNNGKGRSLDAAAGELGVVPAGQRARGVDAHQPVCFSAASRRPVKVLISASFFQMGKSFSYGLIGYRRNPEPFHRFMAAGSV